MHYVIGDVHGCSQALDGLLEQINPGVGDRVLFTGNFIDLGPDPLHVIRRLRRLAEDTGAEVEILRGKHEEVWSCALVTQYKPPTLPWIRQLDAVDWWNVWAEMGGGPTAAQVAAESTVDELQGIIGWVLQLPYVSTLQVEGDSVLITPSGLDPLRDPITGQNAMDLLWLTDWQDVFVERMGQGDVPWDLVVHGNCADPEGAGHRRGPVVNVDGGAVFEGVLVAYRIEDGAVFRAEQPRG